ncbi:uncharacterized protein PRCAT00004006001 [Priceomyces carsonii]|uniref:uncharacterized protein n=1 Tax=Priceomyces carsonii TaxID=28549 RepID=UPI002EDA6D94|nr:unnamed protein product [Priceomyces carsonii]
MVLINGVKYACERCIRGHRVTTCTHTDQPLTMIKPKGRPASQCQHCREQRKHKSLHVSCMCGKKGKSPAVHQASCACHKNSHCTCSSSGTKKNEKVKKKVVKSMSDANIKGLGNKAELSDSSTTNGLYNPLNSEYVFEDVLIPFETGNGLFDLFSQSDRSDLNVNLNGSSEVQYSASISPTGSSTSNFNNNSAPNPVGISRSNSGLSKDEGREKEKVELMNKMFPLFPLVGSGNLDDNQSRPLLALPEQGQLGLSRGASNSSTDTKTHSPDQNGNNPFSSFGTIEPKPIKAGSTHSHHYQPIRPKRPESVLSMASTSSTATNASRNFDSISNLTNLPNQSNSSAFPPSGPSEWNKSDLSLNYTMNEDLFDGSIFNDNYTLQLEEYKQLVSPLSDSRSLTNNEIQHDQQRVRSSRPSQSEIQSQTQAQSKLQAQPQLQALSQSQSQPQTQIQSQMQRLKQQHGLPQDEFGSDSQKSNSFGSSSDQNQFQQELDVNTNLFNDLMPPIYETKNDLHFSQSIE